MKLSPLAIALSAAVGLTVGFGDENAALAQQIDNGTGHSQLIAQFRIDTPGPGGINIDVGGSSSDSDDTEDSSADSNPPSESPSAAASGNGGGTFPVNSAPTRMTTTALPSMCRWNLPSDPKAKPLTGRDPF